MCIRDRYITFHADTHAAEAHFESKNKCLGVLLDYLKQLLDSKLIPKLAKDIFNFLQRAQLSDDTRNKMRLNEICENYYVELNLPPKEKAHIIADYVAEVPADEEIKIEEEITNEQQNTKAPSNFYNSIFNFTYNRLIPSALRRVDKPPTAPSPSNS